MDGETICAVIGIILLLLGVVCFVRNSAELTQSQETPLIGFSLSIIASLPIFIVSATGVNEHNSYNVVGSAFACIFVAIALFPFSHRWASVRTDGHFDVLILLFGTFALVLLGSFDGMGFNEAMGLLFFLTMLLISVRFIRDKHDLFYLRKSSANSVESKNNTPLMIMGLILYFVGSFIFIYSLTPSIDDLTYTEESLCMLVIAACIAIPQLSMGIASYLFKRDYFNVNFLMGCIACNVLFALLTTVFFDLNPYQ